MTSTLTPEDVWLIETMQRQGAVMAELAAEATAAADPVHRCRLWLAVDRQAAGYRRYLELFLMFSVHFGRISSHMSDHASALQNFRTRAQHAVGQADEQTRSLAKQGLGLRLAVVGKGGVGKTVLVATMARLLARQGRPVLVADLDTSPGLALSLGLPLGEAGLPREAVEQHPGANYGWQLAGHLTPVAVVEKFARRGPDDVHFLGVGKISSLEKEAAKSSVAAVVQVLLGFARPDWDVIADLEAGPTTPFERYHAFASDTMVVVGPAWRSAMTARRLWPMVADQQPQVIGNRFRDEPDHPGLAPFARIPFDPDVRAAECLGLAPIDVCPQAAAIRAITELTERFLGRKEVA